jgi:hypothetical protein
VRRRCGREGMGNHCGHYARDEYAGENQDH